MLARSGSIAPSTKRGARERRPATTECAKKFNLTCPVLRGRPRPSLARTAVSYSVPVAPGNVLEDRAQARANFCLEGRTAVFQTKFGSGFGALLCGVCAACATAMSGNLASE